MSYEAARSWVIRASLASVGSLFVFVLLAPLVGYPLNYPDVPRLLEISTPVLLSYLGAAVRFVTHGPHTRAPARPIPKHESDLLTLVIKGPILVFVLVSAAAFAGFGLSNRTNAPVGKGMDLDQLSTALTAALGILTASTSALVSYLFHVERRAETHNDQ